MHYNGRLLQEANNNVTVAVSGGVDSLAILHFLKIVSNSQSEWDNIGRPVLKLGAFHYNHNLRPQNHLMRMAVEQFCQDHKIPLIVKNRPPSCRNDEASLRKDRYQAMVGLGTVITGHHLDDACESYLMNCFNGVPEYLPIPLKTEYKDMDLTVIRPFILCQKKEFEDYVKSYGHDRLGKYVVEDETNTDEKHRRNWVRYTILPQINEKGYNIHSIVRRMYEKGKYPEEKGYSF